MLNRQFCNESVDKIQQIAQNYRDLMLILSSHTIMLHMHLFDLFGCVYINISTKVPFRGYV